VSKQHLTGGGAAGGGTAAAQRIERALKRIKNVFQFLAEGAAETVGAAGAIGTAAAGIGV